MASQWFYKIMGEESGPISARQLLAMARSGELRIDDLVRKHVDGDWVRAENVVGLFDTPSLPVVAHKSIAVINGLGSSWGDQKACGVLERPLEASAVDAQATRVHANGRPEAIAMTLRELPANAGKLPRGVVVPRRTLIGGLRPGRKTKRPAP